METKRGSVRSAFCAAMVVALTASACGSSEESGEESDLQEAGGARGPDIGGIYRAVHHSFSSEGCATEGASVGSPPYFKMSRVPNPLGALGGPEFLYAFTACPSAIESECAGSVPFVLVLWGEAIPAGWKASASFAYSMGDVCTLSYSESPAVLVEAQKLRIEERIWRETKSATTCSHEEASEGNTSMPCAEYRVLEGERIGPLQGS